MFVAVAVPSVVEVVYAYSLTETDSLIFVESVTIFALLQNLCELHRTA